MLHRQHLAGEAACSVLENYDTENIREFAQEILEEVTQGYVLKNQILRLQSTELRRINGRR